MASTCPPNEDYRLLKQNLIIHPTGRWLERPVKILGLRERRDRNGPNDGPTSWLAGDYEII